MEGLSGKTGFVRPTFEEYPNRYTKADSVSYVPSNPDFSYTADDLMSFFGDNKVDNLIVINPDNPSGNYIPRSDMLRLVSWSKDMGIKLVVDESFVDFADEEDSTLICQDVLDDNPDLYIMKSISKSCGVPGIRLGVLASGDKDLISRMKKDVSIWNINSFGEFYMQIAEKYTGDYVSSLKKVRSVRAKLAEDLSGIKGVRVIPSQANFFMVEIDGSVSPKDLLKALLIKHDILIKELTSKSDGRNYLRLAVRSEEDNIRLIKALKAELDP